MGLEHSKPLRFARGAEFPHQGAVQADGGIVRRPEFVFPGAFRDPGRVLEDAAEPGNEGLPVHRGWPFARRGRWMHRLPVPGDVDAPGKPDLVMACGIFDEAPERHRAAGPPDKPAMQADGEHFCAAGFSLGIEGVEAVAQIGEELVAGIEALRDGETHVVGVQRVGNHQLVACAEPSPIGQVIGINI